MPENKNTKENAKKILQKDSNLNSITYPKLLSKDKYFSIEEKNLFHPKRTTAFLSTRVSLNEKEKEDDEKIEDVYPFLYGTLIFGTKKLAILKFKEKENKKKIYTIDDTLEGNRIFEILPDRVILEGAKRTTILLKDPKKPKKQKTLQKTPLKRKKEKEAAEKIEVPDIFKTSKNDDAKPDEKEKEEIRKKIEETRKLTPF